MDLFLYFIKKSLKVWRKNERDPSRNRYIHSFIFATIQRFEICLAKKARAKTTQKASSLNAPTLEDFLTLFLSGEALSTVSSYIGERKPASPTRRGPPFSHPQVRLRPLRQEVQAEGASREARTHSHGRETFRLPHMLLQVRSFLS